MKVEVWFLGKTKEKYLREGVEQYRKRLKHYLPIKFVEIPDIKQAGKLSSDTLKQKEGSILLGKIQPGDQVILLDEKGETPNSRELAHWMDKKLQAGASRLLLIVGGAFGFSEELYARADGKLSLSRLTFSHQMVRLFLLEQLYRAMTILRNEPYHND